MTNRFRHPRKRVLAALGLVCLLLLPASSGCDSNPTYPATPAYGLIKIFNSTADEIGIVRLRKSGTQQGAEIWSYNLLSSVAPMPGYDVFTLLPFGGWVQLAVPPGTYDFFLQSADESTFWILSEIVIEQNQITPYTLN